VVAKKVKLNKRQQEEIARLRDALAHAGRERDCHACHDVSHQSRPISAESPNNTPVFTAIESGSGRSAGDQKIRR
jgi:hypothetical protein